MTDETPDSTPLNKLVSTYIKIRDRRELHKKEFETHDKELEAQQDLIKAELLRHCKVTNSEGGKTEAGTFTRGVKSRYWTSDWESMNAFILEHKVPEFYEKRLQQSNVKQFLEDNPNLHPPGLNIDTEYTITVRRSKG